MKALQQSSDDVRLNHAKVDILLIQDATTSVSASIDFKDAEVTLHSAGEEQKTITVPVTTENYTINNGNQFIIKLELVEQKLLKPQGEITLQNDTLIYGKTLSVLRFNEAKFVDADTREEVVGTLVWSAPDDRLEVGDHSAEWIFTPDNVEYAPYTGYISAYSREILNGLSKNSGIVTGADNQQLGGIWKWEDENWAPTVGQSEHMVYFEPFDTQHYEISVMDTVTLTVKKARPVNMSLHRLIRL